MAIETLSLSDIEISSAIQVRDSNDEDTIERYAAVFDSLPPITVYRVEDDRKILADGFHRWAAANRIGRTTIDAEVRQGTELEASEQAIYANLHHGRPLTPAEYRRAAIRLNNIHPEWSNVMLAQRIGRSEHWVRELFAARQYQAQVPQPRPSSNPETTQKELPQSVMAEITRAPEAMWRDLGQAAAQKGWSTERVHEVVEMARQEPEAVKPLIAPVDSSSQSLQRVPADDIMPLIKQLQRLNDMLDPTDYDWEGGRFLIAQTLENLYVTLKKATYLVEHLERFRGKAEAER